MIHMLIENPNAFLKNRAPLFPTPGPVGFIPALSMAAFYSAAIAWNALY